MPLAFPPFGASTGTAVTLAASTWRWDGVSGSVLVSSGFPLKPGQVTTGNLGQMRVYVGGVEQAVALHPLDGTFPNGSYRSVGIQFNYTLTHDTPVAAEIRLNQGARGTTDLTWVEPTPTIVAKKAVIAPTDPVHLCGTQATLTPLTPATNDTGVGADFAAAATAKWTGTTASGAASGSATYDFWTGLWNMYCRTGTRSWYQWAYDWSTQVAIGGAIAASPSFLLLPHNLPVTPGEGPPGNCTNQPIYNPDAIVGLSNCGVEGNEAYGMRYTAYVAAYWMTGWRQYKRTLAMLVQHGLRHTPTGYTACRDFWISGVYGIRFNLTNGHLWPIVAAYLVGCTTPFAFSGTAAITNFDYETFLDWILDAYEYYTWGLGDYRDGLVGLNSAVITEPYASGEYGITNFQLSLVGEFLMAYYDHVKPDPRIPGWMQTLADYIIAQTRLATAEEISQAGGAIVYVTPYNNLDPAIIAVSTFTANTTAGSPTMVRTGGPVPLDDETMLGVDFYGPGVTAGSRTHMVTFAGSTMNLNNNVTTANTGATYHVRYNAWYHAMFPSILAWVAAYTGNATYMTWADRYALPDNSADITATKNWGEIYGGTRLSYLYYRNGGTVRGTPGVHPTSVVNPPAQPTLG